MGWPSFAVAILIASGTSVCPKGWFSAVQYGAPPVATAARLSPNRPGPKRDQRCDKISPPFIIVSPHLPYRRFNIWFISAGDRSTSHAGEGRMKSTHQTPARSCTISTPAAVGCVCPRIAPKASGRLDALFWRASAFDPAAAYRVMTAGLILIRPNLLFDVFRSHDF